MAETPMIYKAITDVMADVGAVGKNQKNQQQGFMFRGIDAVMNAINPALIKHKVFVVPEILEQSREERQTAKGGNLIYSICKVKYTFFTTDGSSISATVIGEGMDSGDKATNKAMSIAFKYACFQVLCIPTEEMKDPDADSHEVAPGKKAAPKTGAKDSAEKKQTPVSNNGISPEKSDELEKLLKENDIKVQTVCELYNIKGINELTEYKYENIMKHIDDIKKKQDEKEEKGK